MATSWDLAIAARTVWAEARGDGNDSMIAVAWAIVNRRAAGKWYSANNLAGCCLASFAFSSWNDGDPNGSQALRLPEDDHTLAFCANAIMSALNGTGTDPVAGATHYYNPDLVHEPRWVTGLDTAGKRVAPPAVFCCKVGRQLFYKSVQ